MTARKSALPLGSIWGADAHQPVWTLDGRKHKKRNIGKRKDPEYAKNYYRTVISPNKPNPPRRRKRR